MPNVHLLELVALGYMLAMMIKAAEEKITAGESSEFLATKLSTGAFFLERTLPETALHLRRILAGRKNIADVAADAF